MKWILSVNKTVRPEIMFVNVSLSTQVLSIFYDETLSSDEQNDLIAKCPTIDLHTVRHKGQILDYLISLFAYYFQIPQHLIHGNSDMVDDLERHVWARELDVSFENVTYGRLLCSKDDDGNIIGGLEDRGMIIGMMYMMDFAQMIGIKIVEDPMEATFEAAQDDFGSYYDCGTIDDLTNLIFSVCEKLID